MQEAGAFLHEGRFAVVEPGSFMMAVLTTDGVARWSDPLFTEVVGDVAGSPDYRRLVMRLRHAGRATGLVGTASRGPLVVQLLAASHRTTWPLPPEGLSALVPGSVLFVAFAPSRSVGLARASGETLGLTPREVDLAAALLEAPSLHLAAGRAGMSRETAKDTLKRACRRVGARNAAELMTRLLDLACSVGAIDEGVVGRPLGLTVAETRVAVAASRGESIAETARNLDVAEATVKSHRKNIYAKTGVSHERDLRRLLSEASKALELEGADEIIRDDRASGGRLRLIARPDGRRAAFIDYGPTSGRPLLVFHGHSDWRRLPDAFVQRLNRDGWRPVVTQRPGFGLTDPSTGDFLKDAADDMAAVLDAIGGGRATVFCRGPGFPAALAFAERHPSQFVRGVVANPHPTRRHAPDGGGLLFGIARMVVRQRGMIPMVIDHALRRATTSSLRAMIERLYDDTDDALPPDRPDIVAHLIGDIQALYARSTRGVMDELGLYARGWSTPQAFPVGPWRIALSTNSWSRAEAETCINLPGHERRDIEGVVVLRAYTHPDMLADLLLP